MKANTLLAVLSTTLTAVPAPVPDPQEFCCVRISPGLADDLYKTAPLCENVKCSFKRDVEPRNSSVVAIVIPSSDWSENYSTINIDTDAVV
ncbi:hypothetical protein N7463_001214 [Penicillium fimorum]|uniref:Uncharacterized protein n=1 Tax=Penicillium fimorum TaxID=1882269 RepID=A0A9W9Y5V1_9EURO|nr:hypothetical protein N7463_001214 [Penicillium fimorum]